MEENNKNQIMKMGKILGDEYFEYARDSLTYANKKIDTFASLLIAIVFSSVGLSVQLLNKDGINSDIISLGIISLAASIIFGFIQLFTDYKFFVNMNKIYNDISTKHSLISTGEFQKSDIEEALELLKKHEDSRSSSNMWSLCIESVLVLTGAILIFSQLLF